MIGMQVICGPHQMWVWAARHQARWLCWDVPFRHHHTNDGATSSCFSTAPAWEPCTGGGRRFIPPPGTPHCYCVPSHPPWWLWCSPRACRAHLESAAWGELAFSACKGSRGKPSYFLGSGMLLSQREVVFTGTRRASHCTFQAARCCSHFSGKGKNLLQSAQMLVRGFQLSPGTPEPILNISGAE